MARELWKQRGSPAGPQHADWVEAERRLLARQTSAQVPEDLPINAEEKWLADIERKQDFESR
jgi:hypothetical protein